MSNLGCIGHIMKQPGLQELISDIYADNAVVHMMQEKLFHKQSAPIYLSILL
jgi:hypothetical protein